MKFQEMKTRHQIQEPAASNETMCPTAINAKLLKP